MLRIVLLVLLLSASTAQAQIFLRLVSATSGPIPGDATYPMLEGTIEVESLQWGAARAFAPGQPPSALSLTDVSFSKQQDISSLPLIRAQGEGEILQECRFFFIDPSLVAAAAEGLDRRMPMPGEYLQIELTDAIVSSYSTSGVPGSQGESVSIFFSSIRVIDPVDGSNFVASTLVPSRRATIDAGASTPSALDPLALQLPGDERVDVEIVDRDGRRVLRFRGDELVDADGVLRWNGHDETGRPLEPGVYTATIRSATQETTRRIVIGE